MIKQLLTYIGLLASLTGFLSADLQAQPPFSLSDGVYRLPYSDGTTFNTNRDHFAHTPMGAYDLAGTGGGPYQVVAAGHGVIRAIDDTHDNACMLPNCGCNNYVWIEHPNGEWSKYTHMSQGSVTGNGWAVGDTICAGDILGPEDDIGCASGDHLHFEVGRPFDLSNPFTVAGGFMGAAGLGDYLIPVFCGVDDYILDDGDDGLTANPCDTTTCPNDIDVENETMAMNTYTVEMAGTITAVDNVTFSPGSAGLYQAASVVLLTTGFTAEAGSEFTGRIGPCNSPPWPTDDCMSMLVAPPVDEFTIGVPAPGVEFSKQEVNAFPSPFTHRLNVVLYLEEENTATLALYDLSGQLVKEMVASQRYAAGEHLLHVEVPALASGVYLLRAILGGAVHTVRVVKG